MHALLTEIQTRWHTMFNSLASGSDAPPSLRLRTEGLMEAAVLANIDSPEHLTSLMEDCYQRCFGRSMAQDFDADWQDFYPFPQIPAMSTRAPVYPSTAD